MKMWSGRFRQPLDAAFERWQRSFDFDQRLLRYEITASSAHARALKGAGVLSSDELISILQALEQIEKQAAELSSIVDDPQVEDVHHFLEKQIVGLIGETGYTLHSGRSRNEQIATDLRLYVRDAIDELRYEIGELCSVLCDRAQGAGDTAMPAYTHLQKAEPVLVAHWLLAYAEMFLRDADRLADCRRRVNVCPLGSGAVAGATLPLNRELMAETLGFDFPTANSIDATSDRDFAVEFVQTLSLLTIHLSRWAEEMVLFSSQEYAFLELPELYSTGSSAMPQKKNPDLLELVRGKCGRVIGNAIALMVTLKGTPLAYNKDLQETQQPLFESSEVCIRMLPLVAGWMKAVEFKTAKMMHAAQSGFTNAWAAATYLVQRGLPSRLAHDRVGNAVQMCIERGCELQDLPLADLQAISALFKEDFYQSLQLTSVLALHDVPGGTATTRVRQALRVAQERANLLRKEIHAHA